MIAKKPAPMPRKTTDASKSMTSGDIAAHLAAFAAAGGEVEVLGVTRTLKNIDDSAASANPPAPRR